MHVAAGFMPVFKYRQKNSLIVLEHGHKARGYVSAPGVSKIPTGLPANDVVRFRERLPFQLIWISRLLLSPVAIDGPLICTVAFK